MIRFNGQNLPWIADYRQTEAAEDIEQCPRIVLCILRMLVFLSCSSSPVYCPLRSVLDVDRANTTGPLDRRKPSKTLLICVELSRNWLNKD